MNPPAAGIGSPAWWGKRWQRPDFWSLVMLMSVLVLAVLLVLPIFEVLKVGIWDAETGTLSLAAYAKLLTHPYYVSAIVNSMVVGIAGMLGACLLGIPLAYFTTRYALWGRNLIFVLSVMALVSPPFIGAYSWIVVLGNNGWLTRTLAPWGIDLPTIYGVHGIILVFSLKFYPFVYLMTASALRNINRSLEDAAHNLGCSARERFFKVTLPLVLPAVGTAATLCFVLSLADFGTPSIIGREFRTLSTLAYNQYTSEMGGTPTMAVSISMLMILISMAVVYLQRWSIRNRSYASALLQQTVVQPARRWRGAGMHVFAFGVVGLAMLPIAVVVYTSFLKTRGPVFLDEFGWTSYERVLREIPDVIGNTFLYATLATVAITLVGSLMSYLIVRRESRWSGLLDAVLMVPYVVPGVVMAIGFLLVFNQPPVDLVGSAAIIVLILFIRRLPYGVRATTSVLRQIKPSIEEAAVSLGASPAKAFFTVTARLMLPGIVAGAMMSFITAINELSSTLLLYNARTATMPVKVFSAVLDGEFGLAAALSTILLVSTGLCVYAVLRFSQSKESAFL